MSVYTNICIEYTVPHCSPFIEHFCLRVHRYRRRIHIRRTARGPRFLFFFLNSDACYVPRMRMKTSRCCLAEVMNAIYLLVFIRKPSKGGLFSFGFCKILSTTPPKSCKKRKMKPAVVGSKGLFLMFFGVVFGSFHYCLYQ